MKNVAELPPSALNESPESTPLFDPAELKENPVKEGIKERSEEYFKALNPDKEPTPKDWNRYLQFQVARKRADKDSSKFKLDPQDQDVVEQYSKKLADESTWADGKENIDYLSVAQGAMALRYLGAKVGFSEGAAQSLQAVLKDKEKQFTDPDKALRYGIALKNLGLIGDDERDALRGYYQDKLSNKHGPAANVVIRLAQLDKLGISVDQTTDDNKQRFIGTLQSVARSQLTPDVINTLTTQGLDERRHLVKALAVSRNVLGDDSIRLDEVQQKALRELMNLDKKDGRWKEFLDDAIYAKQLDKVPTVALDQEPAPAPEPSPAAAAETVEDKLDETTEGPMANKPALPTQPEQSTQPEATQPPERGFNVLTAELKAVNLKLTSKDYSEKDRETFREDRRLLAEEINRLPKKEWGASDTAEQKGTRADEPSSAPGIKAAPTLPEIPAAQTDTATDVPVVNDGSSRPAVTVDSVSPEPVPRVDDEPRVSLEGVKALAKDEKDSKDKRSEPSFEELDTDKDGVIDAEYEVKVAAPVVQQPEPSPEKGFLKTVQGAREWLREHPKTAKTMKGAAIVGASVIAGASLPVAAAIGAGYFTIQAGRKLLKVYGKEGYWSAIKNIPEVADLLDYVNGGKGFWRKFGRAVKGVTIGPFQTSYK